MMKPWLKISIPAAASLFAMALAVKFHKKPIQKMAAPHTIAPALKGGFLNLAPEVRYVGDEECAVCHSEIFKTYKQTGMGRSFYLPSKTNLVEDFHRNNRVFEPKSNLHYQMILKGDEIYQIEYRPDEKGRRTHELARKADFVIGSGNQGRTYLTNENGFLYELPVTWYSDKGAWGMSPGFHHVNSRFSRPIVPGCMNCHNSYAQYVPFSGNRYAQVPLGIGCERCHGPGELHVKKRHEAKLADAAKREIDKTIVNPRHLPVDLQMDVCRQCHLQGEVRVLKKGRSETDFRPGMRLNDVRSVYIPANLSPGDFRVASHGERISLSACYTKSGGRLVCITCHNPHQPVQWLSRDFFNDKCLACHELETLSQTNPHAEHLTRRGGSDCVACHMPQGETSDVLHVNFTDHWIRKDPQAPAQHAPKDAELQDFFGEKDSAANLRLGMAYLQYFEETTNARKDLDRAVSLLTAGLKIDPTYEQALYALGKAYLHLNRLDEARRQFHALTQIAPRNALAHFQLAQVLHKMEQLEAATAAYQASLNLFPENAIALTNLGNIQAQLGNLAAALDYYQKAVQAQPSYALAHNNMGEIHAYKRQDPAAAVKHFLNALDLDPDCVAALNNFGNVKMASGNYAEAVKCFARVIALDPRFVPAYGNLAYIHSLQGQNEKAASYLRRILDIDPQNVNAKSMLERIAGKNF
jgi:tetratricopeptide (TPR) repeat protein